MKSSYVDEEIREVLSDRDDAIFAEYLFACFCSDAPPRRLCAWTPTRIGQCYIICLIVQLDFRKGTARYVTKILVKNLQQTNGLRVA